MNSEKRNARGRGRGRGRGRARGRGRGRGKKVPKVMSSDEEECSVEETSQDQEEPLNEEPKEEIEPVEPPKLEVPSDISQLEAPVFTTLQRGPPEPMLRLDWDHRASLIGEKVLNPMIYCCDICSKPILIYGRMIPCKHVFCLSCARADHTHCPRCREKVLRVEQTGLGTVYMCTHSGTRYGNTGCRRTYLSQRDLQAHINHRHVSGADPAPEPAAVPLVKPVTLGTVANDPRHVSTRRNLITVPLQEAPETNYYNYYPPPAPVATLGAGAGVLAHNLSVPPPYYAQGSSYATNYTQPQPGTSMSSNLPASLPSPASSERWPEGYAAPAWPQHYYR